ncbi:MAG: aminotransferase class I/II-fold pyridoxal phosphate-dependent enzyme [Thermomicrobiales bacterium]
MTSAPVSERPDTPMGRALAHRVLTHLERRSTSTAGMIDLTTAEPAPTPEHVGLTAKTALNQGETHYTDASGIPQLRAAIARHLGGLGFAIEPQSIGVSNGGTEAVYIALQVALKPGDRALVVEPMSQHMVDMVTFIGAEPVRVGGNDAEGFLPDPAAIEGLDARALLIASPSPITGRRVPDDRLEAIITAARAKGISVILDLSYAAGLYEPAPVGFSNPQLAEEIVLTGSFSTAHGLAGWRIGYFCSPAADRVLLQGLKTAMSICTTAVSQFAAVAALGEPDDWFEERRSHFAANRDSVIAMLDETGISYITPDAFPPLLIDVGPYGGGDAVAARLADAGVIVDPGSNFGGSTRNYIRINLGVPREALIEGVGRIVELTGS